MPNKILQPLADNQALLTAVKELILKQFSTDSLVVTDSDELLGQMVRARIVGIKAVENAFKEIERYKSTQPQVDKTNPAR